MKKKEMVIKVDIADKLYRMTINAEDEEMVRRAALRIKNEMSALKKKFQASHVDFLAMAALQISIENETNAKKLTFSAERIIIEEINTRLEEILGEE